jgi:ABC-type sulfate transport system permease component
MSDGAPPPAISRRRRWRTGPFWLALQIALSASLLGLLLLPIYGLFTYAPLSRIVAAAENVEVREAIWLTLYASGIAVLATALLAVPLGYLLARRRFFGRSVVESLVTLPIVVPHLMVGLGLFFLLAVPGTPLYDLTHALGIPVYYTIWGVVLVMAVVSAPYTVVAAQLSFQAVDSRVVETARSLGAGSGTAFLTVTLPIASRGIIAGLLLTWARAVSEIGGILILAYYVNPGGPYTGPLTNTISVYVYNLFQLGDWTDAAAVSSLFLLISFVIFFVVRLGERTGWLPWRRGDLAL